MSATYPYPPDDDGAGAIVWAAASMLVAVAVVAFLSGWNSAVGASCIMGAVALVVALGGRGR